MCSLIDSIVRGVLGVAEGGDLESVDNSRGRTPLWKTSVLIRRSR